MSIWRLSQFGKTTLGICCRISSYLEWTKIGFSFSLTYFWYYRSLKITHVIDFSNWKLAFDAQALDAGPVKLVFVTVMPLPRQIGFLKQQLITKRKLWQLWQIVANLSQVCDRFPKIAANCDKFAKNNHIVTKFTKEVKKCDKIYKRIHKLWQFYTKIITYLAFNSSTAMPRPRYFVLIASPSPDI